MTQRCRPMYKATTGLLLALWAFQAAFAMADSDYLMNWQPKPLVDTSKPSTTSPSAPIVPKAAAVPGKPELEAQLKPAEPFIHGVEGKLSIQPKPGVGLVDRLNNLQTVLFGATKYQDARELLSKLAEIFPQEAAKAHTDLTQQLQSSLPPARTSSHTTQPQTAAYDQPSYPMASQTTKLNEKPKKKHFWQHDDWDSDFENDPFFRDDRRSSTQAPSQNGPSKLSAIGQSVAGLAMMAGSLAGTYYLNKKLGNGTTNNQPYYGNDPYYNGYGGYGYPYSAYGYGGGYPYGRYYNNPYGYGTYPYGGAYGSPYGGGGVITTRPYQPYGSTSFGAISPLGTPTGF